VRYNPLVDWFIIGREHDKNNSIFAYGRAFSS